MQASMKPPSPLHAPEQRPLKPPSPLQPKNAPKTPISQPQRRRRFQLRLGRRPQRRRRFQPHTGTSAQRRWRFQTTGPPGRQSQAAVPVGGGWASPQHPWAISVTNVVKPEQFEPPCECSCYERRQSASKNLDFQRKSRRIGSSPVEWCNRFVSFGLGYALSWSGVSSCWVGWGVSRDLVRMSRLR